MNAPADSSREVTGFYSFGFEDSRLHPCGGKPFESWWVVIADSVLPRRDSLLGRMPPQNERRVFARFRGRLLREEGSGHMGRDQGYFIVTAITELRPVRGNDCFTRP